MIDISHSIEDLNKVSENSMISHLGIEYTEITENYLCGKMPVDHRTVQPHRTLHGGACSTLAETLASLAGTLCVDRKTHFIAGLDISANFVGMAKDGYVYGKAVPVHLDELSQVWEVNIVNDNNKLICTSIVRLAVLKLAKK